MAKVEEKVRINHQIRSREIRVIDADGAQLGVMTPQDAQRIADQKELDLVEVAPTANPPVCRIMDYGKFRYAQKKKAQESRKKGAASQLKEVKMGSQTSQHDVDFKVNHIRDFLGEGHRVKVTVFFRGRQITHPELGHVMLNRVAGMLTDIAVIEQSARMEGRSMSMMLVAK
ncbi:MAG TPA: translation initiation factor IF-3 [Candidatus Eisenbacteria bacterium]|nr:translation initiation factor IF-3 [Candidatus Eisenbacteria bacterium]